MAIDSSEVSGAVGIGVSAATGNWIGAAIGAIGLGAQIFGGVDAASVAKQQSEVSQDQARQEQGINDAKQQAMETSGRRMQLENIRNNQRARAMAENSAVNQGAQFGSGLQGGLAQINDNSLFNMAGVNDALATGRTINSYNQAISADKIKAAGLSGQAATDAGIASVGGALMKAGPIVGQFSQGFGKAGPTGNNYGYTGSTYGNGQT